MVDMLTFLFIFLTVGLVIWCLFKIITGGFKVAFKLGLFIFIIWLIYIVITFTFHLITGDIASHTLLV